MFLFGFGQSFGVEKECLYIPLGFSKDPEHSSCFGASHPLVISFFEVRRESDR